MKKLLSASLPALALLALGGCAATQSVATTEDDGVYYSSKDRTTAVAQAAPARPSQRQSEPTATAPAPADNRDGEATNPDYQGSASTQRQAPNSPEYYDEGYSSSSSYYDNSRFRQPYAGPTVGLAYYNPPVVLASPYDYGYSSFSPYGYGGALCDPFYSPLYASPLYGSYYSPYAFYSPFSYGYGGSFFSLSFGFGRPWGGYSYGYGRPYYGAYGYDPFFYGGGGGYYGGGYGGGYYGGGYNRQIIRPNGSSVGVSDGSNPVLVGPRRGRGGDVLAGRGAIAPTQPGTAPGVASPTGGRRRGGIVASPTAPVGGVVAPTNPTSGIVGGGNGNGSNGNGNGNNGNGNLGRRWQNGVVGAPNSPTTITDRDQAVGGNAGGRLNESGNGRPGVSDSPTPTPDANGGNTRRGWRRMNDGDVVGGATTGNGNGNGSNAGRGFEQPQQPGVQPEQPSGRRRGFFGSAPDAGQGQAGNSRGYEAAPQQQPQRTYEQPAYSQPQRTYERPQRTYEQPTYSQPQPQRTYERPSQPSYSAPSYGGGSGSSGGGGGGGRRGGR